MERNVFIRISQIAVELHLAGLNASGKESFGGVLSLVRASSFHNTGRLRIILVPVLLFMRVIEILTQLVRHWRFNVMLGSQLTKENMFYLHVDFKPCSMYKGPRRDYVSHNRQGRTYRSDLFCCTGTCKYEELAKS